MTVIKRYDGNVSHSEDGGYVSIKDHATAVDIKDRELDAMFKQTIALQEQVQKLAAENVRLIELSSYVGMRDDYINYERVTELRNGSPATDAVIREIQTKAELEGMVKGAGRVALEASQVYRVAPQNSDERSLHKTIGNFAHMVARRIRAGEQP